VLEKYEWVEKNMGSSWVNRIMLTKDKTIVKAEILIDDKPAVSGVENIPAWELVLYDRPYNQGVDRKRITWNNWQSVILMERSK
jgi:5'-nucleotidase